MSEASSQSDTSSHSSFSTGTGGSVISNDNSDAGALAKLTDRDQDASIQDLLQQNKGFWDAAFSCLLLLTRNREVKGYRMLAFRVVFEYLQIFRLVFNTRFLWVIHTDMWIWKAMYWVLFRFLVWDMGYDNYVLGMYVICGAVLALTLLTVGVAVILRKDDSSNIWLARLIWLLQSGALLVFSICWVAVVDSLVFMVTCHWGDTNTHTKWGNKVCIKMPHLANMAFGMGTALLTVVIVCCLNAAECSGNLVSDNLMSSPVAETALKTTALKIVMICVSTCLDELPKPQAVLMFICPCLSAYLQISSSPYLLPWMNHLWTGLWTSLVYTTGLQLVLHYYVPAVSWDVLGPDAELAFREIMTWAVLYGIFPAVLLGMGISWLMQWYKNRPLKVFEAARVEAAEGRLHTESAAVMKKVYRFRSPGQVAFLARCVRRFDPITDNVLPEAAALCHLIIQAGLARFPGHPTVLLVYANYIIHVKKEPRAARQQLQLASKGEGTIFDRYAVFTGNDVLKRNRSDSDAGLDLMAYVEFQRNYRACVKAHKMALLAQRAFWRSLLRDSLRLTDILASFKSMEAAEVTAKYVYKRVLERYPQNGKLLKVYGRFQEWVLHDPHKAARSYAEAIKRGLGDNMLNLTSDDSTGGASSGQVDDKLDGVVIIDASGVILMANKVAYKLFGYARGEMDGKNVSILMPQPFSSKHDSFLSNYLSTGNAKILNSQRGVVALRKDHTIFPLSLMVTRLSGQGAESIFMGVMRTAADDDAVTRAWCTMTGIILCCDPKLEEWVGAKPTELTGRQVVNLGMDTVAFNNFVMDAIGPKRAEAAAGKLKLETSLKHTYLQKIDVEIITEYAGTDNEPVLVLNFHSLNESQRIVVVDDKLRIVYASDALAKMLGTTSQQMTRLALPCLVTPPCAQLHNRWILDMGSMRPQISSCRQGAIVSMLTFTGSRIAVRLEMKTVENANTSTYHGQDDQAQRLHIVKVHKCTEEDRLLSQRLALTVDQRGIVLDTSASPSNLFGFEPQSELIGLPLAAFINVFEEFRIKQQKQQQGHSGATARAAASSSFSGDRAANEQYSRLALQIGPGPDPAAGSAFNGPAAAAAASDDDSILLTLLAHAAHEGSEACYRVGVRANPLAPDQIGKTASQQQQAQKGHESGRGSSLLQALGNRSHGKLKPALMRIDVIDPDWSQEDAASQGVRFKVQLLVTDFMRAVLELDERLKVVKPDPIAGQMMGMMSNAEMRGQHLYKLANLPEGMREAADILQNRKGKGLASALKTKRAGSDHIIGPLMEVDGHHADGQPVKLMMQAVTKDSKGNRLLLRIKIAKNADPGNLAGLLHLCAVGSGLSAKTNLPAAAKLGPAAHSAGMNGKTRTDTDAGTGDGQSPRGAGRGVAYGSGAGAGAASTGRGLRFAADEAEGAAEGGCQGEGSGRSPRHLPDRSPAQWEQLKSPKVSGAGARLGPTLHEAASPGRSRMASGPGGRGAPNLAPSAPGSSDGDQDEMYEAADVRSGGAPLLLGPGGDGGELMMPGPRPDHGGDGASDIGSEDEGKMTIGSEMGTGDMEEDVTCDWRRAKRLRKILRQLESPAARGPLMRLWRGTWGVVLVLLVSHIVCYAVLANILAVRHTDVYGVQQLANAVDRSQMILLRANFMSKCAYPEYQHLSVCSPKQRDVYISKSLLNVAAMQKLHSGVYLGSDASQVVQLSDSELMDWWTLPKQREYLFYDSSPPSNGTYEISLWNLGNRYIHAANEMNYAYQVLQVDGRTLEQSRYWQYVIANSKDTLYNAYASSLDLYVLFCWDQLGGLSSLLTGLLVAELVAVAVAAMVFQLDSVRQLCKQRMACFSVFLALPSATLRTMATAPCQVDEDDAGQSDDEDELELLGGAQEGEETQTGAASAKTKSVRMAVGDNKDAGGDDDKGASSRGGKPRKLLGKKHKKEEMTGVLGWAYKKYRTVRHAAHGTFNRVAKINGKKLHPARGAFGAFLLPLLAWWIVALVIYGISFQKVAMLQAPLTSLQSAAHVQFNIARTRMLANLIGFLFDGTASPERTELVTALKQELSDVRNEYFSMLYGGRVGIKIPNTAPVYTTSSLFRDPKVADLFFKTRQCLRIDKSTCHPEGSPWYDVSHGGIDMMVQRALQELDIFAKLPPINQTADHISYEYTWRVMATDLYEGLAEVSDVFVGTTLTALDALQQLHTYLLIATVVVFVAVVLVLLVPFRNRLMTESLRLAGLLSQLPQESDVEGHVKVLVIDAATGHKPTQATQKNWTLARGITAAARAAANRAAGAVSNMKARMAEASAASAAAAAAEGGGWQQYQQYQGDEEDGESQPDWE